MLIWLKVLFYLSTVFGLLLPFRFYKTKYFLFFFVFGFLDVVVLLLSVYFHLRSAVYFPLATAIFLISLPLKQKEKYLVFLIGIIIAIPYLVINDIIASFISTILITYILFFLITEIANEIKIFSRIPAFMLVLVSEFLINYLKIFFYYQNRVLFIKYSIFFHGFSLIVSISLLYLGIDKKINVERFLGNKKESGEEKPVSAPIYLIDFDSKRILDSLTKREKEILSVLAKGLAPKEIAEYFSVEPKTIYFHLSNIREKLDIPSTHKLMRFAQENSDDFSPNSHTGKITSTKKMEI